MVMSSQQAPATSCPWDLKQTQKSKGGLKDKAAQRVPKFQASCHTKPQVLVQDIKGGTKPDRTLATVYAPWAVTQLLCNPEIPPWGPGLRWPCCHMDGPTSRPHLCRYLSAICFLPGLS